MSGGCVVILSLVGILDICDICIRMRLSRKRRANAFRIRCLQYRDSTSGASIPICVKNEVKPVRVRIVISGGGALIVGVGIIRGLDLAVNFRSVE